MVQAGVLGAGRRHPGLTRARPDRFTVHGVSAALRQRHCAATAVVLVTSREPDETLYRALVGEREADPPGLAVQRIGDCVQPGLIAHAVYSGHRAARELGGGGTAALRRERVLI